MPRPQAPRVIAVANQKGGVGKTTSAVNLAAAFALDGLHAVVVDLDPQGNASTALGVERGGTEANMYDVVIDERPLSDIVVRVPDIPGLWCAPASFDLAGAEIELVSMVAREHRVHRSINAYLSQHVEAHGRPVDYVLIDCPPSLGLLTVNALVAAREVLLPIQCEYYALEGLGQLLRTIDLVRTHLNPELELSAILLTMFDARTRLAADVAAQVREHFGGVTLPSVIPRSVRLSEAPSHQQTVMTYDPGSPGARTYWAAARDIAFGRHVRPELVPSAGDRDE